MQVINLDKFSSKKQVEIDGKIYDLRLYSVKDFIEGKMENFEGAGAGDNKAELKAVVDFVKEYSNIPKDVLMQVNFALLTALSTIIQGGEIEGAEGGQGNA